MKQATELYRSKFRTYVGDGRPGAVYRAWEDALSEVEGDIKVRAMQLAGEAAGRHFTKAAALKEAKMNSSLSVTQEYLLWIESFEEVMTKE